MTDKLQPIIDAMVATFTAIPTFLYVDEYSLDSTNLLGQRLPAVLIREESLEGVNSAGTVKNEVFIQCYIYQKDNYLRAKIRRQYQTLIKSAILSDPSISNTACNVSDYTIDNGTDGISDDYASAGTYGDMTISQITFKVIYEELI
jgi:hypothetical protein